MNPFFKSPDHHQHSFYSKSSDLRPPLPSYVNVPIETNPFSPITRNPQLPHNPSSQQQQQEQQQQQQEQQPIIYSPTRLQASNTAPYNPSSINSYNPSQDDPAAHSFLSETPFRIPSPDSSNQLFTRSTTNKDLVNLLPGAELRLKPVYEVKL